MRNIYVINIVILLLHIFYVLIILLVFNIQYIFNTILYLLSPLFLKL